MMANARHAFTVRMRCSMTSKKPASSKRAVLPQVADYTKAFRKDWQRLSHSGR